MLNTSPIPSHLIRHNVIGKPRRAVGDPVAPLKDMTRFIPVPQAPPSHLSAPFSIFDPAGEPGGAPGGQADLSLCGGYGGVHGTATEEAIAVAMEDQIQAALADAKAAFFYNLGDVIYFNGQSTLYKSEFYEPYQYYPALIFAIPGNHDGDTQVYKGDAPDTEPSLYGFTQNFCAPQAEHVTPYRMSMTQPYVYWTLDAPFVTVVGVYSNVEGSLDARGRMDQQSYLEQQMSDGRGDPVRVLPRALWWRAGADAVRCVYRVEDRALCSKWKEEQRCGALRINRGNSPRE
jgi:hypothetical protein